MCKNWFTHEKLNYCHVYSILFSPRITVISYYQHCLSIPTRMSIEEFLINFDYLDICHLTETAPSTPTAVVQGAPNGDTAVHSMPAANLRGRWLRGVSCGGRPYIRASHWANPQYRLSVGSPDTGDPDGLASVVIALMQADRRRLLHRAPRLVSIGFVVYRVSSRRLMNKFWLK